jgi:hypothetical protein
MPEMIWFDNARIPIGNWPFLSVARSSLVEMTEDSFRDSLDLMEGMQSLTLTGCLEAYRQVIIRRTVDIVRAVVVLWNSENALGSLICARALLETLATFHDFFNRVEAAANSQNYEEIARLVDSYSFSTSNGPARTLGKPDGPPSIGRQVIAFIEATQPGASQFWHQICDAAHPNGAPMFSRYGELRGGWFYSKASSESETDTFQAIYNCIYSICWLYCSMGDFDKLLDDIRHTPESTISA